MRSKVRKCLRTYYVENNGSRPITEDMQLRVLLVFGRARDRIYRVMEAFSFRVLLHI